MNKLAKTVFIFILSLVTVYSSYIIAEKYPKTDIKTKPAIFKSKYIPPNKSIIRVEVEIYDDTTKDYYDVIEVEFDNKKIDLLNADASGARARQYFQLESGEYTLKWTVSRSKGTKWPQYETFQKTVILKDTDKYVHILIVGDKVTTS